MKSPNYLGKGLISMEDKETSKQLQEELHKIVKWERTQKKVWIWEKIGRVPFLLLDKMTPRGIREKLGLVINEIGSFIQTGGQYLVHHKTMMRRLERHHLRTQIIPKPKTESLHFKMLV